MANKNVPEETSFYIHGVAALQHGSFERPAVGVEQGNPQVGEGQAAHRISKVFLVFSVFHLCFMQCSCTVSAILLFIYILSFDNAFGRWYASCYTIILSLFVGRIGILYLKKLLRHEAQEKQKHTCMYTMYTCIQFFESICKRRQGWSHDCVEKGVEQFRHKQKFQKREKTVSRLRKRLLVSVIMKELSAVRYWEVKVKSMKRR